VQAGRFGRGLALLAIGVVALIAVPSGVGAATDLAPGSGAVVTADALNVRGGPGRVNPVVTVLDGGTSLKVLAGPVDDVWWRVTDGQSVGYVDGDWLQSAPVPSGTDAFDLDLSVPIHRQLTRVWCDPADLESWVEYDQNQSLGDSYAAQQRFWDWELSHNAGFTVQQWDASPFAVASAAHQWLPDRGFNHFIYDDAMQATATAAWVLANPSYREPSVATIWYGDHYVLMRGVRATADPFASYPNARILGVYVMDPNQGRPSWLGQDRYISIDAWVSRYLTPVSYLTPGSGVPGDVWQGKYVMIQRDWANDGPSLAGRVNVSPSQYQGG
jgi:hypothetical protein